MKITFDKIYHYSKSAFVLLLNTTYFLAIQDNVNEVFYDCLF